MSNYKMSSPSESRRQKARRNERENSRELRRLTVMYDLFKKERPGDAEMYMMMAERQIAVEHARAKGEL